MEDKVDVIRCKDCKHAHENKILGDDYVACRFIESFPIRVDKNGFCHRAEPKETNRACGACRHFEYYEHISIAGASFEGICRGFGNLFPVPIAQIVEIAALSNQRKSRHRMATKKEPETPQKRLGQHKKRR